MKKTVIFVEHYKDAPDEAKYILREMDNGTARLDYYENGRQIVLKDFGFEAFAPENFKKVLNECFKYLGDKSIIYVERPFWMYE